MKTKIYIAVVFICCLACSEGFLEENPRSVLNPLGFYSEEAGLRAGLNAAYANLRPLYGESEEAFRLTIFGTDLFTHGKFEGALSFNNYDVDLNPFAGEVSFLWSTCYKIINLTNTIIASAPEVEMDGSQRERLIGEARFIRALSYYWLVQQFGDVPLKLEPTIGMVMETTRTPEEEVYRLIVEDLSYSVEHLETSYPEWGSVRKGAAQHLLSKVYLILEDWQNAADLAMAVINDPNYALEEDFSGIFHHENQINPEIIFSVQYENDFINSGSFGNRTHLFFTNSYSDIPGMERVLQWGRPWTRFAPTAYLMGLYEEEKDERTDIWRTFDDFYYNNPATLPEGKNVGDPVDESWRNTIEFHPALIKYWDPTRPSVNDPRGNKDFIVFRLAETYLIVAEALMMQGRSSEAVIYFNTVRQRAARPGMDLSITEGELDIDMILDERGRELAGEMHRWFDLKRTGKALERIKAHSQKGQNIQPHHLLRPLPQNELDLLTTPIEQNPNY
jgi:hypothetical protein